MRMIVFSHVVDSKRLVVIIYKLDWFVDSSECINWENGSEDLTCHQFRVWIWVENHSRFTEPFLNVSLPATYDFTFTCIQEISHSFGMKFINHLTLIFQSIFISLTVHFFNFFQKFTAKLLFNTFMAVYIVWCNTCLSRVVELSKADFPDCSGHIASLINNSRTFST